MLFYVYLSSPSCPSPFTQPALPTVYSSLPADANPLARVSALAE